MNNNATTRKEILKICRNIVQDQGFNAINIRTVARTCGISIGSIYNYFDSKSDLISAVVESVWSDIFHHWEDALIFQDTEICINWIYGRLTYGAEQYPGFFTHHSLGFMHQNKNTGRQLMQQTWQHIIAALCAVIQKDPKVQPDVFTEHFTVEKFADILFSLILAAMLRNDYDSNTILMLIHKILY